MEQRPTLAVWKFSSCDGCQLSLLDVEDDLLAIADQRPDRALPRGVERDGRGAVRRLARRGLDHDSRGSGADQGGPRRLAACWSRSEPARPRAGSRRSATTREIEDYVAAVYASPEYISTLATSTPIADHVDVDFELRGCPINKQQLLELVSAMLHRRRPNIATHSVCVECKSRGIPCVMVSHGNSVPRAGHPGRLRRDLPRLQPRLLRLLRSRRDAEHGVPRGLVAEPRRRRARPTAGARDV